MRSTLLVLFALATTVAGCSSSHRNVRLLQKQAAFDFNCPAKQIQVTPLSRDDRLFAAQGCGRRATYQDMGAGPVLASPIEGQGVSAGVMPPPPGGVRVPPPPPPPPPPM